MAKLFDLASLVQLWKLDSHSIFKDLYTCCI